MTQEIWRGHQPHRVLHIPYTALRIFMLRRVWASFAWLPSVDGREVCGTLLVSLKDASGLTTARLHPLGPMVGNYLTTTQRSSGLAKLLAAANSLPRPMSLHGWCRMAAMRHRWEQYVP